MQTDNTPKGPRENNQRSLRPLQNENCQDKRNKDHKYIEALLNNDTVLLDELYRKFSGKIKTMVLKNNGTETDAADIFQDALLFIYYKAKMQNFVLTCPLDAFLYMICKNRWLNELKKRKAHKLTFPDQKENTYTHDDCLNPTEKFLLQQARADLLKEKITELSKNNQEFLQLCWSGKSLEEIAGILKISYGYARKKKSEIKAKLIQLVLQSPQFDALKYGDLF